MNTDELRRRVSQGLSAGQALDAAGPYMRKTRAGVFENWAREGNPELRERYWHLVRGLDLTLEAMQGEIDTGKSAALELAHFAEQEKNA